MAETHSYVPLLMVLLLALAVPIVLRRFGRFGIPIVVGEIVAGMIVGRSGLRLVPESDAVLDLLAEFGFVFLMFLAGLEVDFSRLGLWNGSRRQIEGKAWGPVPLGALVFVLTLALSTVAGLGVAALGLARNPWMVALILSTSSLGVIMPILKEKGLSGGRFGQSILVAALIADFGTMLLITLLVAVVSRGVTFDILLVGLLFVAFFLLARIGTFSIRLKAVRRTIEDLSHATAQIKVRAAFATMLVFVVLSQAIGTEVILGAFLAGAVLSLLRTPDDAQLGHQLEAIGFGFFIPLFFIQVGVRFSLAALFVSGSALALVPILLAAAVVVKLVPGLLFRNSFTWREAFAAGSILSARLSLIIAASAIGLRLGIIGESLDAAIILVAILSVTLAPLVFGKLASQPSWRTPAWTVVFGLGELGLRVARQLQEHQEDVRPVDPDAEAVARARQHGLQAEVVGLESGDVRLGRSLEHAATLVCTHADAELNLRFCELARTVYGADNIIVNAVDPAQAQRYERIGAKVMNAALNHGALLALVARTPSIYALLTRTDDDKEVWEVIVCEGPYVGSVLRQLPLPGDVLVLALRRDDDLLVPHGNTRLTAGDRLTLAGSLEWVEETRLMFGSQSPGSLVRSPAGGELPEQVCQG
jgi:Kef-type K+ transport system membrane component KefB/Trk K+ transport system NAD-binding subunit